jgi:hypothetical protein
MKADNKNTDNLVFVLHNFHPAIEEKITIKDTPTDEIIVIFIKLLK